MELNASTKICKICRESRPLSDYYKRKSPWGIRIETTCRRCCVKKTGEWAARNPDNVKASKVRQKALHPERRKAVVDKSNAKIRSTAKGRLSGNMSALVRYSLKSKVKATRRWESLVGFTSDQLMRHLEKQFLPGMSWENRSMWDIDHKIPLAAFNFEKPEDPDFQRAWALKNLRPLWKSDNRRKGARLSTPFQPSLTL